MMTSADACGPWPTRRDRRSKDDIAAVKAAIVAVLEADHPMTVRQVFYQLVVRGAIDKTEGEYQEDCRPPAY
jgi:hypothetical protein